MSAYPASARPGRYPTWCVGCQAYRMPHRHRMLGAPDPSAYLTAAANAQVKAASLPADAEAAWNNATSAQAGAQAEAQGIDAATSLVTNGYDEQDPNSNQQLIQAIAGGAAFIPPFGLFSGAIEILDSIGEAAASALEAIGLISKPGCTITGKAVTVSDVLAGMVAQGARMPRGTFAALAFPVLAYNVVQQVNCKPAFVNSWVLDACVRLWNQTATGPVIAVSPGVITDWAAPNYIGSFTAFAGTALPGGFSLGTNPPDLTGVFQPSQVAVPLVEAGVVPGLLVRSGLGSSAASSPGSKAAVIAAVAIPAAAALGTFVYARQTGQTMGQLLRRVFVR